MTDTLTTLKNLSKLMKKMEKEISALWNELEGNAEVKEEKPILSVLEEFIESIRQSSHVFSDPINRVKRREEGYWIPASRLYELYKEWMKARNLGALAPTKFGLKLKRKLKLPNERQSHGIWYLIKRIE